MTMKVLIVDDRITKAKRLAEIVKTASPEAEIHHATNASDGFRALKANCVHLVLLDVVLPINLGDDASEAGSVWFVQEVKRKVTGVSMPFIVGTTQFSESISKVQETFRNDLWSIVYLCEDDSGWIMQIDHAVRFAAANAERLSFGAGLESNAVDVAVIAALRNPEFSELVNALGGGQQVNLRETHETWLKCQLQRSDGSSVKVLAASVDEMGMTAMASLATRLCISCRPKRLILVGIMAGNSERVNLSDLVIVEHTWNFQVGKLTESGFRPDVCSLPCSFRLSNGVSTAVNEQFVLKFWSSWRSHDRPPTLATVRKGDVACSPFVVADGKTFERLEEGQKRKVLGLEMEAFGLYDATRRLGELAPEVLCLKSVCDFGDGAKNDKYQTYCAALSAAAAVEYIKLS
jgi:nucleoside phosphorylase